MKSLASLLFFTILINSLPTTLHSESSFFSFPNQEIKKISKEPVIELITKSFDADTVTIGTPLTFDVYYKNVGEDPLILTKVRTSCSCTVASFSKVPLPQDEVDKVVLKLDTEKPGTFIKSVAIYSNASNAYDKTINSSRIVFKIKWVVVNKNLNSETEESSEESK